MLFKTQKEQGFRIAENSVFYKWKQPLFGSLLIVVILAVSALFYFFGVGCLWKKLFDISCPTCGITRAYISLFRGDIAAAFEYNFMFPAVPVLGAYLLFGDRMLKKRLWRAVLGCIIIGFLIKWIISV